MNNTYKIEEDDKLCQKLDMLEKDFCGESSE
jgi:hypothetical protein